MQPDSVARRDDSVLVVIDEQGRLAVAMERRDTVLAATVRLVQTAALVGVPIIVTRQYPKGLGETESVVAEAIAAAEEAGASVTHIDKLTFDCFLAPEFSDVIAAVGRGQLIVAGMETHICITQTVLSAVRAGLDVHVAADACCSRDARNHDGALDRLRGAGAVVSCSESVMYELVGQAGTDEFRALLGIVKD